MCVLVLRNKAFRLIKSIFLNVNKQGINEWRNIQDIIRLSFKALTDIVRSQGEAIVNIDKQVQ